MRRRRSHSLPIPAALAGLASACIAACVADLPSEPLRSADGGSADAATDDDTTHGSPDARPSGSTQGDDAAPPVVDDAGSYPPPADGDIDAGADASRVADAVPADGELLVGNLPGNGPTFSGLLDELTLYGRALSGVEVASIYQAGSRGKCRQ